MLIPLLFFLHYIPSVEKCYRKFSKYFQDDFIRDNSLDILSEVIQIFGLFWIIRTILWVLCFWIIL